MENLSKEGKTWPMILDMTKDDCKRALRALELTTYSNIISVFRAQGELTKEKRKLLSDMQSIFSISLERHRAEIRRAVNDEILNTLAETLAGPNTNIEWSIEGRRLIPLLPRVPPQVTYTALATQMAQVYCGINAKLPKPSHTANYGKMDDLGADSDLTDSEEETEGLRFLPESMIPQQYIADKGTYTTLPHSVARIAKEKAKEAKEKPLPLPRSPSPPPVTTARTFTSPAAQPSLSVCNSINSISSFTATTTTTTTPSLSSAEKRKRKRSVSTDHTVPHPPPPPPSTQPPPYACGVPSLGVSTAIRQLPGISSTLSGSSMKITVTGGITRTSSTPTTSLGSQTQKVILVSTSAASGSVYQRSINVPILKSQSSLSNTMSSLQHSSILKNVGHGTSVPASTTTSISTSQSLYSGSTTIVIPSPLTKTSTSSFSSGSISSTGHSSGSFVGKIRPRMTGSVSSASILSGGSTPITGLPARLPRQRSNSLILQTDTQTSQSILTKGENVLPRVTSLSSSSSVLPDSTSGTPGNSGISTSTSLSFVGSSSMQLRAGALTSVKSSVQVRSDGTKLVAPPFVSSSASSSAPVASVSISSTSNLSSVISGGLSVSSSAVAGRILGRTSSLPTSQGLYVVSTNSGTITVVTRTVASGQGSITTPRVVTVNTVSSRSSLASVRNLTSPAVVSVGITPKALQTVRVASQGGTSGFRPMMAGSKNNVIVVHKGPMPAGTRPVGIHGIRDLSGKFITKAVPSATPSTGGASATSTVTSTSSCLTSGLVVVKPTSSSKLASSSSITTPSIISAINSCSSKSSNSVIHRGSSVSSISSSIVTTISSAIASTSISHGINNPPESCESHTKQKHTQSRASSDSASCALSLQPSSENASTSTSVGSSMEKSDSSVGSLQEPQKDTAAGSSPLVMKISTVSASSSLPSSRLPKSSQAKISIPEEEDHEAPSSSTTTSDAFGGSSDSSNMISSSTAAQLASMDTGSESLDSTVGDADDSDNLAKQSFSTPPSVDPDDPAEDNEWINLGLPPGEREEDDGEDEEEEEDAFEGVERAVEVLQQGDREQARTLLFKAGFELIDSTTEGESSSGDVLAISNLGGVSSSSTILSTPLISSTPSRDEGDSSLGSVGELDPTTGLFFSPSAGENSSEPGTTSTRGESPTPKDEDSLTMATEFMENTKEEDSESRQ